MARMGAFHLVNSIFYCCLVTTAVIYFWPGWVSSASGSGALHPVHISHHPEFMMATARRCDDYYYVCSHCSTSWNSWKKKKVMYEMYRRDRTQTSCFVLKELPWATDKQRRRKTDPALYRLFLSVSAVDPFSMKSPRRLLFIDKPKTWCTEVNRPLVANGFTNFALIRRQRVMFVPCPACIAGFSFFAYP